MRTEIREPRTKEDVHAGDFKVELSGGFTETDARVAEYVVTEQLQGGFPVRARAGRGGGQVGELEDRSVLANERLVELPIRFLTVTAFGDSPQH
ncbi:hypothetical protein ACQEVY_03110 [Streptomyces sp. CA-288835]|uniref:hypothetical protein n=1 Tax=Streptomyces sp. CA-288835 TaxID=3240069 RepID=UPI003D929D6C